MIAKTKHRTHKRNRLLYGGLFVGVLASALMYGDPFMFMTLYALVVMPVISLIFATVTLFGTSVSQKTIGPTVVKGEANQYIITLHNSIRIGFGSMRCLFKAENFAVETNASDIQVDMRPFMPPLRFQVDFVIKYRGVYQLGLESLEVFDFLGLFRLRRKLSTKFEVIAYPRITELEHMQIAVHLLSKAPANLALSQEDYADYTDVRPYEPSDPIKKVHWKLTAKRGEWIVKNYQSSVLNSIAIMLDADKRNLSPESVIKLEDAMMECAVAVLQFCLRQQMPAEFLFGRSIKERGRHIGDFESMYNLIATLEFKNEDFSINDALTSYLSEYSRNVNVVILTSKLDMMLYERILNAVRFGHYIAVMYFAPEGGAPDRESSAVFERLLGSGLNCIKI